MFFTDASDVKFDSWENTASDDLGGMEPGGLASQMTKVWTKNTHSRHFQALFDIIH